MILLVPVPNAARGKDPPPVRQVIWSLELPVASAVTVPAPESLDLFDANEIDALFTFRRGSMEVRVEGENPVAIALGSTLPPTKVGSSGLLMSNALRSQAITSLRHTNLKVGNSVKGSVFLQQTALELPPDEMGEVILNFTVSLTMETPRITAHPASEIWAQEAIELFRSRMMKSIGAPVANERFLQLVIEGVQGDGAKLGLQIPFQVTGRQGGLGVESSLGGPVWDTWLATKEGAWAEHRFLERVPNTLRFRSLWPDENRNPEPVIMSLTNAASVRGPIYLLRRNQNLYECAQALSRGEVPLSDPFAERLIESGRLGSPRIENYQYRAERRGWIFNPSGPLKLERYSVPPPQKEETVFLIVARWNGQVTLPDVLETTPPLLEGKLTELDLSILPSP